MRLREFQITNYGAPSNLPNYGAATLDYGVPSINYGVHKLTMELHNSCLIIDFHKSFMEHYDWFFYLHYYIIELHNSIFVAL